MADKITAPVVRAMKGKGRKIVCVTAYDCVSSSIADAAGVDVVLVGDSVGNTMLGYSSTLPVTLDDMLHHTRAAARGMQNGLLVGDMPLGSYQSSVQTCVESACALVKAGAEAVKLEGPYLDEVRALVKAGIPVMAHLGMTPQSVNAFGGHRVQGRGEAGDKVLADALALQEAGAFSLVLELVPAALAERITRALEIPTIGIGAGPHCDGQVQVFHDVMGLGLKVFRHAKRYANGRTSFVRGLKRYAKEVREGTFPDTDHSF